MSITIEAPAPVQKATVTGYFTLPRGAKPSKAASSDVARQILNCGHVVLDDRQWYMEVTNSYVLSRIPLTVTGEISEDYSGSLVPREALLAIEKKGAGSFSLADDSVIVRGDGGEEIVRVLTKNMGGVTFPDCKKLVPKRDRATTLRVGLSPDLLKALAAASGGGKNDPAILSFDLADETGSEQFLRRGIEGYLRPILVTCNGTESVLMPIRIRA